MSSATCAAMSRKRKADPLAGETDKRRGGSRVELAVLLGDHAWERSLHFPQHRQHAVNLVICRSVLAGIPNKLALLRGRHLSITAERRRRTSCPRFCAHPCIAFTVQISLPPHTAGPSLLSWRECLVLVKFTDIRAAELVNMCAL